MKQEPQQDSSHYNLAVQLLNDAKLASEGSDKASLFQLKLANIGSCRIQLKFAEAAG